ncbi:hypothetical protein EON65_22810 [archaeon]|nr:MAG: hypothetical protein EON65_22810 [archaeon]
MESSLTSFTEADAYSTQKRRIAHEKQLKKMDTTLFKAKGDCKNAKFAQQQVQTNLTQRQQDWVAKVQDTQPYESMKNPR